MTLIKWNPSVGKERQQLLLPSVDSFFGSFLSNDLFQKDYAGFVPTVNIFETEKNYAIELAAPGYNKNDFNISIEEGVLTISGSHKSETTNENLSYIRKEFNYGSFKRSFNLADLVNEDNIDAKYDNGILKIQLPKNIKTPNANTKQIHIS